jgi:hypothetical protein
LRTLEISELDRLTADPRVNAKAAAEVVMVAPSTMATGSFIVLAQAVSLEQLANNLLEQQEKMLELCWRMRSS